MFYLCFLKKILCPLRYAMICTPLPKKKKRKGGGVGYSKFDYRLLPVECL